MKWSLESTVGQIVDDLMALAVVEIIAPGVLSIPEIDKMRDLSLSKAASLVPEILSPKVLAQIEDKFSKL